MSAGDVTVIVTFAAGRFCEITRPVRAEDRGVAATKAEGRRQKADVRTSRSILSGTLLPSAFCLLPFLIG
jgi:hypothetical protein